MDTNKKYENEIKSKQTELVNITARITKEIADLKLVQAQDLLLQNAKHYERLSHYLTEISKQTFDNGSKYTRVIYFKQIGPNGFIIHKYAQLNWVKNTGKINVGVQDIPDTSIDGNIVAKLKGRIFDNSSYRSKKTPATVNAAFDKASRILSLYYKDNYGVLGTPGSIATKLANEVVFAWVASLVNDYFDNIIHIANTAKKFNI